VGYKKPLNLAERKEIIEALAHEMFITASLAGVEQNADALDAAVCVLAASDFCLGRAVPPVDPAAVASEGWIWTRIR
jgi:hypothetical protein